MDREDKNKEVSLYIHIPFCMQNVHTVILHLIVKKKI
ncbi:coproporphyrinogen III oxidase [Clostridium botulinum CFSAN002369]|nr:coproporphyrinogen III oxidase [Clostridium botulinum CFSAN002369]